MSCTSVPKISTSWVPGNDKFQKLDIAVPTKLQFMPTPDNAAHAVLIYSLDNDKFKVKDSLGVKYEIPINRPDSVQVYQKFKFYQLLISNIGTNFATSWITKQSLARKDSQSSLSRF